MTAHFPPLNDFDSLSTVAADVDAASVQAALLAPSAPPSVCFRIRRPAQPLWWASLMFLAALLLARLCRRLRLVRCRNEEAVIWDDGRSGTEEAGLFIIRAVSKWSPPDRRAPGANRGWRGMGDMSTGAEAVVPLEESCRPGSSKAPLIPVGVLIISGWPASGEADAG